MKQRMKKALICFFSFVFVANVACRVRDTYLVPRVVVERPVRTALTHSFQAEGYFTSNDKVYIQPKAGWKIGKVLVTTGTRVEEKEALWQYDTTYLKDLLEDKQEALQKQQITIEQTKLTYVPEAGVSEEMLAAQNVEKATAQVTCEQIWLEEAVAEYEEEIARINQLYDKKEALARQEHDISSSEESDDTQKALLDTRLKSQLNDLKEEREQEKESAYEEIISQNKSLFQALQNLQSAKQSYDNATITQQVTEEIRARSNKSVALTISVLEIEEAHLLDEIALIEEYVQQDGYVYAKSAGNVTNVELTEGHLAGGEEKVEIAGISNAFVFSLPEEDAALLTEGDVCYIHVAGIARSKEGTIKSLQPEKGEKQGNWEVTCIQSGEETWDECRWNQQGTVTVSKKTEEYNCCIPIEALVFQNGAYYCRVVVKEQTILGTEEIIQEIPVIVVDKDISYACVTAEINEESKVVTDYNKAISDGDRVRVVSRL